MGTICTWMTAACLAALTLTASDLWAADGAVFTKQGVSGQVYAWQSGTC